MKVGLRKGSRTRVLALFLVVGIGLFVLRLFLLQVVDHEKYAALANQEQVKQADIPAKRGLIYALDGQGEPTPMVLNQSAYFAFADPKLVNDSNEADAVIAAVRAASNKDDFNEPSADLIKSKTLRYVVLARNLTLEQVTQLKEKKFSGVGFTQYSKRVYPNGSLAGQVLGFVNNEGKGQYGVEAGLDNLLEGKDGVLKTVTDPRDVPLTIGSQNINIPAQDGKNVVLTLDRNVQAHAEDALKQGLDKIGATHGSVLVMDPNNGKVLAMANYPSFNPAEYNKVTDASLYQNTATMTPFEPGSVMKTLTTAMGVDTGAITPQSLWNNQNSIQIGGISVCNASLSRATSGCPTPAKTYSQIGGTQTYQTAIDWSLNSGMVNIAQSLDKSGGAPGSDTITLNARKTMYDYFYNKYRIGRATGIELPETFGAIQKPDASNIVSSYATMSFGQGVNPTMIQMASAFSAVVTDGVYRQPTIIAGTVNENQQFTPRTDATPSEQIISQQSANTMREVIHHSRYGAYPNTCNLDTPGYYIGGKTGTAQFYLDGKYSFDQLRGVYLGYGGSEKTGPQYVIMVQVWAKGKTFSGDPDANGIFSEMSNWLLRYKNIAPENTSCANIRSPQ